MLLFFEQCVNVHICLATQSVEGLANVPKLMG